MKKEKPFAVVLGLYGSNALGVVRSLGAEKIPTVGFHLPPKHPYAISSKYLSKSYFTKNEKNLLPSLIDFGKKQKDKSILFPTGDRYLNFCSKNYKELQQYFYVPNVPGKNLEELLDKNENSLLGKNAGFDVPTSTYLSKFSNFKGPVIVKPLNSIAGGKEDMEVYNSEKELLKDRKKLLDKFGDMAIQDFIPGNCSNLFEVHAYNSSKGPLIAGMQRNKLGVKKNPNTYVGVIFENLWIPKLVNPTMKLMKDLNFNGALDLNFKKSDLDNKYYFMEVNLRTSANLALDTVSGCNLPAIIYNDLTKQNFNHLLQEKKLGEKWLHEARIEPYLKQGSEEELLKELKNIKATVFYDKKDMAPFNNQNFNRRVKEIINSIK